MSDLIIIRLYPKKPATAAAFTSYLTGLRITVNDMSFQNPQGTANPIGTAFYNPADPTSTIVQHRIPAPPFLPAAAATAIIVVNAAKEPPTYPEYVTADLRLTITRGTQTIVDQSLNYNVGIDIGAAVPPGHNPLAYAALGPVALYLALPDPGVGMDPGRAFVDLPTNGSPPNYADLLANVTKVLTQDPRAGAYDLNALTPAQCRHIAYEIMSNRTLNPLPFPAPHTIEDLYTMPGASSLDSDRGKFEADLITYYTTNSTQAEALAKYVFALSAALACEKKTDDATHAGMDLPVLPGIGGGSGKIAETEVILS